MSLASIISISTQRVTAAKLPGNVASQCRTMMKRHCCDKNRNRVRAGKRICTNAQSSTDAGIPWTSTVIRVAGVTGLPRLPRSLHSVGTNRPLVPAVNGRQPSFPGCRSTDLQWLVERSDVCRIAVYISPAAQNLSLDKITSWTLTNYPAL